MPFDWGKFGHDILGGLEDAGNQVGDALNPLNTINQLGNNANNIVGSTTGLGNNLINTGGSIINKGIDTVGSLTTMLPYLLVGGVVLMVLSKT